MRRQSSVKLRLPAGPMKGGARGGANLGARAGAQSSVGGSAARQRARGPAPRPFGLARPLPLFMAHWAQDE